MVGSLLGPGQSSTKYFFPHWTLFHFVCPHTDKRENESFLIYKEIQSGAVAKSYMRKGFLMYVGMRKYILIYEEAVSHIHYDFATAPF